MKNFTDRLKKILEKEDLTASKFAEKIFQSFSLCLPSSNESMKYLDLLKINNIKYIGNLKLTYVYN